VCLRRMYFLLLLGRNLCLCLLWTFCLLCFSSSVLLLIICLDVLSIIEVSYYYCIAVNSPLQFCQYLVYYLGALWVIILQINRAIWGFFIGIGWHVYGDWEALHLQSPSTKAGDVIQFKSTGLRISRQMCISPTPSLKVWTLIQFFIWGKENTAVSAQARESTLPSFTFLFYLGSQWIGCCYLDWRWPWVHQIKCSSIPGILSDTHSK
jgi:hypothetical protein